MIGSRFAIVITPREGRCGHHWWVGDARCALLATAVLVFAPTGQVPTPPTPHPEGGPDRVLGGVGPTRSVAPGVVHREFITTASGGRVMGEDPSARLVPNGIGVYAG